MHQKAGRFGILGLLSCVSTLLVWLITIAPGQAHWADMAIAQLQLNPTSAQLILTLPTNLVAFADGDRSGRLSAEEIRTHQAELKALLSDRITLSDTRNQSIEMTVSPIAEAALPSAMKAAPMTHSSIQLNYRWLVPLQRLQMRYSLFPEGMNAASCMMTIVQNGKLQQVTFTPYRQTIALPTEPTWFTRDHVLMAIAGAFVWGAMHSLSPGHGKTVVGAYLVGERATAQHALFLALTTTVTHTVGVFALGLFTVFTSNYILSEQLLPWLSFTSGVIVTTIGVNLLVQRLRTQSSHSQSSHSQSSHSHHHPHHNHSHITLHQATAQQHTPLSDEHFHHHDQEHSHHDRDRAHGHSHHHAQEHSHDRTHTHPHHVHKTDRHTNSHHHDRAHTHHNHSHLPPGADGSPVTWRSLLALGVSGGLIPCPAALVLLLSAIALGQTQFGLLLVLFFSLGLATVLTVLGLLLIHSKKLFKALPSTLRTTKFLPAMSAAGIMIIGALISTKAVLQVLHG